MPRRHPRRALLVAGLAAVAVVAPLAATTSAQAALSPTSVASASKTPPRIEYGDTGKAVKRLQKLLGVKPVSGWFGPLTRSAVRSFETKHGLKVDGVVGHGTWSAILKADAAKKAAKKKAKKAKKTSSSNAYPRLEYDDRGAAVKRLQKLLGVKPASGWFGPLTRSAVRSFKSNHGLTANGIVGKTAWAAIVRADAAKKSSRSARSGRVCPVKGAVFSDTYGAARGGHGHAGVDMLAPRGTKIRAVESGTVVRAHWSGSSGGYTITLQGRSGSKFFYAHNDVNRVSAGQQVSVGQVIARVGSTGNAGTVNHLHFEYWKSGRESDPVNPTPLVRSLC